MLQAHHSFSYCCVSCTCIRAAVDYRGFKNIESSQFSTTPGWHVFSGITNFSSPDPSTNLAEWPLQWRRRPGNRPPPVCRRSENTYRRNNAKTLALCADYAPNVSQGTIFRRSRRRSRRRGLARALRRREGGSAEPVVAGEAGARPHVLCRRFCPHHRLQAPDNMRTAQRYVYNPVAQQ